MAANDTSSRNWRRFALPVSILLNLFLIGTIGGHLLYKQHSAALTKSPFTRALARAEAILPPPDAAIFRAVMKQEKPKFATVRQRLGLARQELLRQLTAEPYDKEGMRQALIAWRLEWNTFAAAFGDTLTDALGQISPEGRRKLAAEHWIKRPDPDGP